MERGMLYGVGVGPGDPELMTLKAIRCAEGADFLAAPSKGLALRIALGASEKLAEKPVLSVDMPMTKDPVKLEAAYLTGAKQLTDVLDQGKSVCFLTLGDPTVYSTYLYLHKKVVEQGYDAKIIPGVTSFCAAAAELGISLCENAQELHIIPGTYRPTQALEYPGVKVIMKNDLPKTRQALLQSDAQVWMVENCGMETQKIYRGAENLPETSSYFTLLIAKDAEL